MPPYQSAIEAPRIFLSYSRDNIDFADQLKLALQIRGIEVFIDRHDIERGEDWWGRIEQLIAEADVTVFALSPGFISSNVCKKELDFSASLGKRLLPIVIENFSTPAPDLLAKLAYVYFIPNARAGLSGSFEDALGELERAIKTDIAWVRLHSKIELRASEWSQKGRLREFLLSKSELKDALEWVASRPASAPLVTIRQRDFVGQSRMATFPINNLVSPMSMTLVFLGALPLVAMLQQDFDLPRFVAILQVLIDSPRAIAETFLRPFDPHLEDLLNWTFALTGWRIAFNPDWKHIFTFMNLFFMPTAVAWGCYSLMKPWLVTCCGVLMFFVISVCVSGAPIPTPASKPIDIILHLSSSALPAIAAMVPFVISAIQYANYRAHTEGVTIGRAFASRPAFKASIAFALFALISLATLVSGIYDNWCGVNDLLHPWLILPRSFHVMTSVVAVCVFYLLWSALNAGPYAKEGVASNSTPIQAFLGNMWTVVALYMLRIFIATAMLMALGLLMTQRPEAFN